MATRTIDDTKLNSIAVAIQAKDSGGRMTVDQMPGRIAALPPAPVADPALILWDWEGTKLAEYSKTAALALTELPAPSTLAPYAAADHELLVFQRWNWSLADVKTWIRAHEGETLDVGAIYTTTDGQNHNYWGNPRLQSITGAIITQKRGVASIGTSAFDNYHHLTQINIPGGVTGIGNYAFQNCYSLTQSNIPDGVTTIGDTAYNRCSSIRRVIIPRSVTGIGSFAFQYCFSLDKINLPDSITTIGSYVFQYCYALKKITLPGGVTGIGSSAFRYCYTLTKINIPANVTSIGSYAFDGCYSLCDVLNESQAALSDVNAFNSMARFYVPRARLSWFETATNWATFYTQDRIVAIEDNIDYLESIGFNVDAYKGA